MKYDDCPQVFKCPSAADTVCCGFSTTPFFLESIDYVTIISKSAKALLIIIERKPRKSSRFLSVFPRVEDRGWGVANGSICSPFMYSSSRMCKKVTSLGQGIVSRLLAEQGRGRGR